MALKMTMFSDFICPFCYIGHTTMHKVAPEFDIEIEWRGFEIHPEWPAAGVPAERVFGAMSTEMRKGVWNRIATMASDAGITMNPPSVLTNSHSALLAAEFAKDAGKGREFEVRVYRAYFEEGVNIGDLEVLKRLAADVGVDSAQMIEAIGWPGYENRLRESLNEGRQRGVTGVPTFFINEFPFVGAQSEDVVRSILARVSERFGAAK